MPVVLINIGAGRTSNLLTLINEVRRCAGHPSIAFVPESITAPEDELTFLILGALDEIQQELFDVCKEDLVRAEWLELLDPANTRYTKHAGLYKMLADPRVAERQLKLIPQDEIYRLDPEFTEPPSNLVSAGAPTSFASDGEGIVIYPRPSPRYLLDKYVYEDSGYWACAKPHASDLVDFGSPTSGTTHAPNIWIQQTTVDPSGDDLSPADFAWEEGRRYSSAYITTPYSAGPWLMRNANDTPALPYMYYTALVAGACWRVKAELNFDQNKIDEQGRRYHELRAHRIAHRRRSHKNPRLRYEVKL